MQFCDENNKVADYGCKPEIQIYKYDESRKCCYEYYDEKPLNKLYDDFEENKYENESSI